MKLKNRLFCLLLALVLLVSLFPLQALAATEEEKTSATVKVKVIVGSKTLYTYEVEVGDKPVKLKDEKFMTYKNKVYKYSVYKVSGRKTHSVTIPAYDGTDTWEKKWCDTIKVYYTAHKHSYKPGYNRIYHWNICECGDTTNEIRHVDPATDADKTCTCGYTFSSNAQLTTLWLTNMVLSPNFNKEITEYTGEVRTYLDVTSTQITAKPFDALAKVELPENLEIHEGPNKFEIRVTAEDKTTTQTYTVIAVKPVKVEDTYISADGTTVSAPVKTTVKQQIASAAVSDAVAQKMAEFAAQEGTSVVTFRPEFSKWSVKQTELTLPAEFFKTLSENTKVDLTILTPYGSTLTIRHEGMAALAEGQKPVTIRIGRDNTFAVLIGEEAVPASQNISLKLPEA